jgi:predicted GTPase
VLHLLLPRLLKFQAAKSLLVNKFEHLARVCTHRLLQVGRTGNGKSATGNSILGMPAFKSARKAAAVTNTCQLEIVPREEGGYLAVIDTPGLFDSSLRPEELEAEISNCISLAREGLHALIIVLSVRNRYVDGAACFEPVHRFCFATLALHELKTSTFFGP